MNGVIGKTDYHPTAGIPEPGWLLKLMIFAGDLGGSLIPVDTSAKPPSGPVLDTGSQWSTK